LVGEIIQNPKKKWLIQVETTAEILFVVSTAFNKLVLDQLLVMLDVFLLLVGDLCLLCWVLWLV
jgi:hypothetical protein